jgi:hypothetical protein
MTEPTLKHLEDAQAEIERLEAKARELREKWTPVARKLLAFFTSPRVQPELKLSGSVKPEKPKRKRNSKTKVSPSRIRAKLKSLPSTFPELDPNVKQTVPDLMEEALKADREYLKSRGILKGEMG